MWEEYIRVRPVYDEVFQLYCFRFMPRRLLRERLRSCAGFQLYCFRFITITIDTEMLKEEIMKLSTLLF